MTSLLSRGPAWTWYPSCHLLAGVLVRSWSIPPPNGCFLPIESLTVHLRLCLLCLQGIIQSRNTKFSLGLGTWCCKSPSLHPSMQQLVCYAEALGGLEDVEQVVVFPADLDRSSTDCIRRLRSLTATRSSPPTFRELAEPIQGKQGGDWHTSDHSF